MTDLFHVNDAFYQLLHPQADLSSHAVYFSMTEVSDQKNTTYFL